MPYLSTILMTQFVTHDVKAFFLDKPKGFTFRPGQAVMLSINKPGLQDQQRPFSPTSLNQDAILQFTIKRYPEHQGVTDKLHQLAPGDQVLFGDPTGEIEYKGPGLFIAGGTGITPFISIFRQLHRDGRLDGNSLLYSNKRHEDIVYERELRAYLGGRCLFTLTREPRPGYENRRIDKEFLAEKIARLDQEFYLCGPVRFTRDITQSLQELGATAAQLVFD